jgi:hypothetical protein
MWKLTKQVSGTVYVRLLVPAEDVAGDLRVDPARIDGVHTDACLRYSRAAVRVRPTTPCLDAMYEPIPGLAFNAPTDALLTIAPLPWRSICASSYFMQLQTPRKLIPITRSQSSRVLSAVWAIRAITPELLNANRDRQAKQASIQMGDSATSQQQHKLNRTLFATLQQPDFLR